MDATTDRSVRPPLLRLGAVEARKMVDTRAAMWLLILTALSAVAAVVVGAFVDDGNRDFGELFVDAMLAASVLMPIVPILLVTGEWSQRTALETFTLVPVRERVMAAKLSPAPEWDRIATAAIAWVLVPLALGLIRLRRRDVS
ncbi:MAG: hypothetical protein BroJett022_07410 [Actinomycetes bacterium]|nr:MAG: hypothetical protein BroJett022_07410 [Actinomycetes bacterium]